MGFGGSFGQAHKTTNARMSAKFRNDMCKRVFNGFLSAKIQKIHETRKKKS
jgi:hypothetical protein